MLTVLVTLLLVAVATAGAEKARKLLDQGKIDAAVKAARGLVAKNAKDVDGWLVLADALVAQGEPEEAWTELEKAIEFYRLTLEPTGELLSAPHFPGTEEILYLAKGRLLVTSGEQQVKINKGDSVHYRADLPHSLRNTGRGGLRHL